MSWKEIMKADKGDTPTYRYTGEPHKYKMGYLLCANNCIRAVEEKGRSGDYCAYCGDDKDYQIPPPRGFKFDSEPPKGDYKTAPLGFKELGLTMRNAKLHRTITMVCIDTLKGRSAI